MGSTSARTNVRAYGDLYEPCFLNITSTFLTHPTIYSPPFRLTVCSDHRKMWKGSKAPAATISPALSTPTLISCAVAPGTPAPLLLLPGGVVMPLLLLLIIIILIVHICWEQCPLLNVERCSSIGAMHCPHTTPMSESCGNDYTHM